MNLRCFSMRLPLKDPFTISRGTITHQDSLVVELEKDGIAGLGEVTANDFYGHTIEAMQNHLENIAEDDLKLLFHRQPSECWERNLKLLSGDKFALSALDMAAHDWWAKNMNRPVWKSWQQPWNTELQSSFTIGIDSISEMCRKLESEPDWKIYKIKLGTDHDLQIVRTLRELTQAVFRVDANCGWGVQQTIENSVILKDLGVEFIEQPLPREAAEADKLAVFNGSSLPIIADEDCQTIEDVEHCIRMFHGINVKLCKCGGLTPAAQMLQNAQAAGKKTMIGCMVESHIGISGASQLIPLLDYADLDGANLITNSPTDGVTICNGIVQMTEQNGTGAHLDKNQLSEFAIQSE